MKNIKTTFLVIIGIAILCVGCATKGAPTKLGQQLTREQIQALENDQSMNGKLATVEGYASFCSVTASVRMGETITMTIYSDGFCEGDKLLAANIPFKYRSSQLTGEESRNYAMVDNHFTNETIKYITDDYQEVPNGKFKFSVTIIYDGDNYSLYNVTIHK